MEDTHKRTQTVGSLQDRKKTADSIDNRFSQSHMLFGAPQGVGFSQALSSSTLRHQSPVFSFPKDERFKRKQKMISELEITLPTTLSQKAVTQGYGNKEIFTQSCKANAKFNPPPDRYNVSKNVSDIKKGKTFGISYESFRKVYLPKSLLNIELAKELPPVGNYEIQNEPGQNKLKYSCQGKGRELMHMNLDCPNSCTYSPKTVLQQIGRFTETGFGKGWKYDFTKCANKNPGPGQYVMPSKFDKFDPKKQKIWQQQMQRRILQRSNKQYFV